jgi:hypothetical protein
MDQIAFGLTTLGESQYNGNKKGREPNQQELLIRFAENEIQN